MEKPANRLANERSPYLLQHSHNPVHWHAWGEEAFALARREDKPVFLSIGYSACHWCHVMERESFEDESTAALLNAHYVSIKVDREERPDVDQVYQLAYQLLARRAGGWPLSMFLAPDKRPFYAGTYFPDTRRHGMPSFREVLEALHEAWVSQRDDLLAQATQLTALLARVAHESADAPEVLSANVLSEAVAIALQRAAPSYGGFGRAPKFPNTMTLDLLFAAATLLGDERAGAHALVSLDAMARGGIHDHLGGGFARYSTDEKWLIPHFEKMLYDNAQLLRLYTDGWRFAQRRPGAIDAPRCEAVVRDTAEYLLREMYDRANGHFHSAQDADSEGVEGKYFVWTPDEIDRVTGEDTRLVKAYFDVTTAGNFEHGASALWTPRNAGDVARELGTDEATLMAAVERSRAKLLAERARRIAPGIDDKALASWNALAVSALAEAGATFGEARWLECAVTVLARWRDHAWDGRALAHARKGSESYGAGYLDDHAAMGCAALDVYEATHDPQWLAFARALADATLARFWSDTDETLFYTASDAEVVLHRTREVNDHAYPGGVGLACDLLLRVATMTGVPAYRTVAERVLARLVSMARTNPLGMATVVRAIDRAVRGPTEVIAVGSDARTLARAARTVPIAHRAVIAVANESEGEAHGLDRELLLGRNAPAGLTRAFVCRGTECSMPVTSADALRAALV